MVDLKSERQRRLRNMAILTTIVRSLSDNPSKFSIH